MEQARLHKLVAAGLASLTALVVINQNDPLIGSEPAPKSVRIATPSIKKPAVADPSFAIGHDTCAISPKGIATVRDGEGRTIVQEQLRKAALSGALGGDKISLRTDYNANIKADSVSCTYKGKIIPAVYDAGAIEFRTGAYNPIAPAYLKTLDLSR